MGSNKRACIFFLVLVLAFINITGVFPASASQTSSLRSGVDLVILLDNSNSMSTLGGRSDIEGYRFDAAAIMLNMISLFSSRVSVILFNSDLRTYRGYDYKHLTNVAMLQPDGTSDSIGAGNRMGLTNALISVPMQERGGTLIGTALTAAVKVLDNGSGERAANGNQPMILLLADGKISPASDDKKNTVTSENKLLNAALQDCKDKGYTLYSVILKNANNTDMDPTSISEMHRWATSTGGTAHELADPAVLPEVFSQMFGKQIGSSMVSYQPLAQYDSVNNNYYIEIDIPNKSVEEANILLQTVGLSDFRLYKPGGQEARADSQHVFMPQVGERFTQYKIFRPTENGKWKLTFQKDAGAPDNISVNILYNYTETLEVKAVPAPGPYQKGTRLTLTAQLYKDGIPSADQLLYRKTEDENGNNIGIRAFAYLLSASSGSSDFDPNKALSKIELPVSQMEDSFENTFTIKDFMDASGRPFVKSGKYELYVHVEGAGLVRDFGPVPFEVNNQAPLVTSSSVPPLVVEINDPNDYDFGKAKTRKIDFKNYIKDEDGDHLTPQVRIDQTSIIQSQEPVDDLVVTLQTKNKAGKAVLYFQVTDNENASLIDFSGTPLPKDGLAMDVEVISVIDELTGAFKPKITITSEKTTKGYFEKNSTVDFEVSVEGSHKNYQITDYALKMNVFQENANQVTGEAKMLDLKAKNPTTWKSSLQLDDRANHKLRAELIVIAKNKEELIINKSTNTDISTGNEPPKVLSEKVSLLPSSAEVEPFTLLKQEATQPWTVILDDLFDDANFPYDALTFTIEGEKDVVGFNEPALNKEEPSEAFPEGREVWTAEFTPKIPGDAVFTITATDNSGESASATYNISVTSMTAAVQEKAIKYGSIALAALIVLMIFLRIIKPSFKGMKLTRKRDGNLHGENNLPNTKAVLSLSQFADDTMLRDVGLGKMNLKHVRLKAGRSHILVMLGKGNHMNATIKVGNETLSAKRKKARLNVGREIQVSLNGHTISWLLQMSTSIKSPASSSRRGPNA